MPVGLGGFAQIVDMPPEDLGVMEDDADYKFEVNIAPPFTHSKLMAQQIFDLFMANPIVQAQRNGNVLEEYTLVCKAFSELFNP